MQSARSRVFFAFVTAVMFSLAEAAPAANRLVLPDPTLPIGSTGNVIPITLDLDQDILGFSIYFEFNPALVSVTAVELGSDVAPLLPPGSGWNDGQIDNTAGTLTHGVLFDISEAASRKKLAAGTGLEVLRITVDIEATSATTTNLDFRNITTVEPRRVNIVTDLAGNTISPVLDDSRVTISDLTPRIESFQQNQGQPGAQFFVVGQNFDQAGLAVKVCGRQLPSGDFQLLADNQTLKVTAPNCGNGPAEVEVCTDFGCDSDPAGFDYQGPPVPVIVDIQSGEGKAGDTFFVVGQNFDQAGLHASVCGVPADGQLLGDGQTYRVTAPACPSTGPADVEVCTDIGCDTRVGGFTYVGPVGTRFIRGDSNGDGTADLSDGVATLNFLFLGGRTPGCRDAADANDNGEIDLTDAIFTFNFLFLGGETIKDPYPGCGLDTTGDALDCLTSPAVCQ